MLRENTCDNMRSILLVFLAGLILLPMSARAQEPALPMGLDAATKPPAQEKPVSPEPGLPPGLGGDQEPPLPSGIAPEEAPPLATETGDTEPARRPFDLSGFFDTRVGFRTQDDPHQKDVSLAEARLQLQTEKTLNDLRLNFTGDLIYDDVPEDHAIDLEKGEGWIDIREASVLYRASTWGDFKLGRQVLTWGTGDLIFINDLFPKDWNSFFIGRDEEYLKAPSDALKASFFLGTVNVDAVYTPRFDGDRFIDGRRISYFNENEGRVVGRDVPVQVHDRDRWFDEDEFALRLHGNIRGVEAALYGYWGFWKSPAGFDPGRGRFIFPALNVYGASARGTVLSGVAHIEFGYYDSRGDANGGNPLIRNSELRILLGYERELLPEFTAGMQYYLERRIDHEDYLAALPPGSPAGDENRHVLTLRLTKMMMNQNLTLSLFNFYSPSDEDGYLRPKANYKFTDAWQGEVGGNIFYGSERTTFFGQFEDSSNLYAAIRYNF